MESYIQLVNILNNNSDVSTPISPEKWIPYAVKAENLSFELSEQLYALIINYNTLCISKSEHLPYGAKLLSSIGGVTIPLSSMPTPLQHLIVAFLERV